MKDKVLIVTTTPYMIRQFLMNDIKILQELQFDVEVVTNCKGFNVLDDETLQRFIRKLDMMNIKINQVDFTRNIYNISNMIRSYKQMKKILKNNEYTFIHTHTPIASVISRVAAKQFRKKNHMKVIYTAHGFHFYKGAPKKSWVIFYPIEKYLSKYTDVLITINKEDYDRAKKYFNMKKLYYVPGIGINLNEFIDNDAFCYDRKDFGIDNDDILLISVGELNKNKNHEIVIKALGEISNPKIHYMIVGKGSLENNLKNLARKLNLSDKVHFLGFRNDIKELLKISDIFIFPSFREGLSVSLMEAMASGLPCIVSNIRGNTDLIIDGKGGYLINPMDIIGFSNKIKCMDNSILRSSMGTNNKLLIKHFSKDIVKRKMKNIYLQT